MKRKSVWIVSAVICLVLGIGIIWGLSYCEEKTEGLEDLDVSTGTKNHSLAYDKEKDILYVGTHDKLLVAFEKGEEIWRTQASGSYDELVLDAEADKLYAANEDGHVYVYQTSNGEVLLDIDTNRKAVAVDVTEDASKIAVITNTGSNKSSLLIYSADGEELGGKNYSILVSGVQYCKDGETLLISNKRGEVLHITEDGEVLDTLKTGYEIIQMIQNGDTYWTINRNVIYHQFDEALNTIRTGKIDNTVSAFMVSIGVDEDGEYVLIGTKEGYLFVMDGQDKQIYLADVGVRITDFETAKGSIYFTGYDDFIKNIHVDNLATMDYYKSIEQVLRYVVYIPFLLLLVCLIQLVPKARKAAGKLLKKMWHQRMAYLMLLPTFVLIFLFNYRGIFIAFYRAFTDWSRTNNTLAKMNFIGLDNFRQMLEEGYFLIGMKNLGLLLVTGILKTITVPLAVAWLVHSIRGDKRKYMHRFLFVLPIVVPGVVGTLTWQKIYDPTIGLLNEVLGALHLENLQRVWLGDERTALWAIIFMGFPFVGAMAFLVYYGGLLNIGTDVVESAMIDSATRWDIFWKVQLPLIKPQLSIMVTLTILGTMQDFNGIFIMTGGGPGTATYVPALELYLNASQFGRYGYASALGIVLMIFTLTVTVIKNALTREKE